MQNTMLLESIWQGDIYASKSIRCREIIRLLGLILPLDMVHFSARSGVARSRIVSEHIELLPEIHLGDVLAEELEADVPFGAMIVIFKEPGQMEAMKQTNVSYELGLLVGDTLIDLIKDCVFPIQCEPEVLSVMVNSYCRLVEGPEFQKQKICCKSFREGLGVSIREYCAGGCSLCDQKSDSNLQNQNSSKRYVTMHMKNMDAHVGKKMFGEKSINLTKLHGSIVSGDNWKRSISEAVMGELRRDAVRVNNLFG